MLWKNTWEGLCRGKPLQWQYFWQCIAELSLHTGAVQMVHHAVRASSSSTWYLYIIYSGVKRIQLTLVLIIIRIHTILQGFKTIQLQQINARDKSSITHASNFLSHERISFIYHQGEFLELVSLRWCLRRFRLWTGWLDTWSKATSQSK